MRYAPIGKEGQARIVAGRVLVCGCGALGSVIANTLARAGVGHLRIVDRDFLELNNLQRQVLYDEADVAAGLPKAIAAAERLRRINSQVEAEPIVADVSHANIRTLAAGVDVILDGTDNFETRLLVNDFAVSTGLPWVYGGCIGAEGQAMTIIPGKTACLACFMPDAPPPGTTPTCDTAGIVGPIVNVVASIQAMEALKLLSGRADAVSTHLTVIDVWENRVRRIDMQPLFARGTCRACHQREFSWLEGKRGSHSAVLCGRNAVQLSPDEPQTISLDRLAERLTGVGEVTYNAFLLRLKTGEFVITVFPDGRSIVGGTDDPAVARAVHAKFIGA
jgi:adenylyltransferase/sulfurtransferase